MPVFEKNEETFERLDWQILQERATNLYYSAYIFTQDCKWFRNFAYELTLFTCAEWYEAHDMYVALAKGLHVAAYDGHSVNWLNETLDQLPISDKSGRVLAFTHFDQFFQRRPFEAYHLINAIEHSSRHFLIYGQRLLALIQADDPHFDSKIHPVGEVKVQYNARERLVAQRIR